MVFSSCTFIFFFLPICLAVYYLLKDTWKNNWLLFMSLVFYAWGGLAFLPVICLSIMINYFGGYAVYKLDLIENKSFRKLVFAATVSLNLLFLGYWKYLNFFYQIWKDLLHFDLQIPEIILPIGISFFTFQGLSYVIDVYRKTVPVQKNMLNVGLYIALFPQLIAGPIVRYSDINTEIQNRKHSTELMVEGIRRFTIGLAKKSILANSLAINADSVFSISGTQLSPSVAWIGAISYALQIYFDFSGYSDMAIGLGKMFGFHLLENFNYPYISESIPEFWRRWHISLGNWLKDYLYIPLGGNRKGKGRTLLNKMIVFGLCGLWHGANWTFIFWGLYYGFLMSISMLLQKPIQCFNQKNRFTNSKYFKFFRIARTNLLVIIGWVFFKADSIQEAFAYLRAMFGMNGVVQAGFTWQWYLTGYHIFILCVSCIAMLPLGKKMMNAARGKMKGVLYEVVCNAGTIILLLISSMYVITSTYNPFIYFQF